MVDEGIARLQELLDVGAAIMVATRDSEHRPHMTRGWGGRLDESSGRLDLCLTVSDDLQVVADLEANGAIAVTLVRPTNYMAMQIFGSVEWIGEPGPTDLDGVTAHIGRFVDEVVAVGMPPSAAAIAGDRYVMVRIAMHRFFEQTPGAKAGTTL